VIAVETIVMRGGGGGEVAVRSAGAELTARRAAV